MTSSTSLHHTTTSVEDTQRDENRCVPTPKNHSREEAKMRKFSEPISYNDGKLMYHRILVIIILQYHCYKSPYLSCDCCCKTDCFF